MYDMVMLRLKCIDRILARFLELPPSFAPRVLDRPSGEALLDSCQRILEVFTVQHFVGSATAQMATPNTLRVVCQSPANWWSLQVLKSRNDLPLNDFVSKALLAYFRACKLPTPTYTITFGPSSVTYLFKFPPLP